MRRHRHGVGDTIAWGGLLFLSLAGCAQVAQGNPVQLVLLTCFVLGCWLIVLAGRS